MGLINVMLKLTNPRYPEVEPVEDEALADSGSVYLVIPESVRAQLQLDEYGTKEVTLADGRAASMPYVGPVKVDFKNRTGLFGAVVMGRQILLGAIPMEDMDLVLIPKTQSVDINPAHPNGACGRV